jgi:hypothetical protein
VKKFILFGQETGVLYQYDTSSGIKWKTFGNSKVQPKYEGEIENGKMNGLGVLTYPYGEKSIVGEWKNGKEYNTIHKNKYGELIGERKFGKWIEEKKINKIINNSVNKIRKGHVKITLLDGNLFEGEFNDGILDSKINGQGTYTSLSGSQYVGEWKNGNMNGQGTYTWSDEDKYEGKWKDGKRNGQGTFTFNDGRKYVGDWKDDRWWNGIEYDKNGEITYKRINGKRDKTITPTSKQTPNKL